MNIHDMTDAEFDAHCEDQAARQREQQERDRNAAAYYLLTRGALVFVIYRLLLLLP